MDKHNNTASIKYKALIITELPLISLSPATYNITKHKTIAIFINNTILLNVIILDKTFRPTKTYKQIKQICNM